jgi:hypothetical protein
MEQIKNIYRKERIRPENVAVDLPVHEVTASYGTSILKSTQQASSGLYTKLKILIFIL